MPLIFALVVYLAFLSMGLPDGMIGAALPSIRPEMGVSVAAAGGITLLISSGTVLAALATNALLSRFGAWKITVFSTLLTAGALGGFALSPSYLWLCVCALPLGLGAGAIDAVLNTYVAQHGSSRQMSWVHVAWGLGATGGPLFLAWCLGRGWSWRCGYWGVAAMQVGMTALLFCSRPLWQMGDAASEVAAPACSTRAALRLKGLGCALIGLCAMQGFEFCSGIWAASYLYWVGGFSVEEVTRMAALFYCGMTGGRFLSGFIADRLGDKQMVRLGAICGMCGVGLLLVAHTLLSYAAALLLLGLGAAPLFPCFLHATPTHFGAEKTQAVMGLQMACAYMGATLLPPMLGVFAQLSSIAIFPYYLIGFLLVMTIALERLNLLCARR